MRIHLLDEEHQVLILGANRGGSTMVDLLLSDELAKIVGVVDRDPDAPGLEIAREAGIPVFSNVGDACRSTNPSLVMNLTCDPEVDIMLASTLYDVVIVSGTEAKLMWRMLTRLRHDQRLVFRIVSRLKRSQEQQRYEASHDYLTDLYNRRYLMEQFHNGMAQALRYGSPYAVIMMDVDYFKNINDRYGHTVGDQVLKAFASCLRSQMRSADVAGRFGGDEFLVLLPQTTVEQAVIAGRKWLGKVNDEGIHVSGKGNIEVSFSGGAAGYSGQIDTNSAGIRSWKGTAKSGSHSYTRSISSWADKLLNEADTFLYQAKNAGRNLVISDTGAVQPGLFVNRPDD